MDETVDEAGDRTRRLPSWKTMFRPTVRSITLWLLISALWTTLFWGHPTSVSMQVVSASPMTWGDMREPRAATSRELQWFLEQYDRDGSLGDDPPDLYTIHRSGAAWEFWFITDQPWATWQMGNTVTVNYGTGPGPPPFRGMMRCLMGWPVKWFLDMSPRPRSWLEIPRHRLSGMVVHRWAACTAVWAAVVLVPLVAIRYGLLVRRLRRNRCMICNYSLHAATAARCPECSSSANFWPTRS